MAATFNESWAGAAGVVPLVRDSHQHRADLTAKLLAHPSAVTMPPPEPSGWPQVFSFARERHAEQTAERAEAGRRASRPSASDAGYRGTTVEPPPPSMDDQLRAAADRIRRSDRSRPFGDGTTAASVRPGGAQAAQDVFDG